MLTGTQKQETTEGVKEANCAPNKMTPRQALALRKAAYEQKRAQANAAKLAKTEEAKRIAQEKAAIATQRKQAALAKAKAEALVKAAKAKETREMKAKALAQSRLLYQAKRLMLREIMLNHKLKLLDLTEEADLSALQIKRLAAQKTQMRADLAKVTTQLAQLAQLAQQAHDLIDIELREKIAAEMSADLEKQFKPHKLFLPSVPAPAPKKPQEKSGKNVNCRLKAAL